MNKIDIIKIVVFIGFIFTIINVSLHYSIIEQDTQIKEQAELYVKQRCPDIEETNTFIDSGFIMPDWNIS